MIKSSTLFEHGPFPPYIHLASTRRHSRDRFSQAFPVFRALPLPCIINERKPKNKKRERPGNEAMLTVLAEPVLVFLSVRWILSAFADPLQAISNICGTLTSRVEPLLVVKSYCGTLTAIAKSLP